VGRCQCRDDCFEYAFDLLVDFAIREAKNFVASLCQRPITRFISFSMTVEAMLMSVDFDDHSRFAAFEIDDVGVSGD